MPLTDYQKMVALSPFRYPRDDLYKVMDIIARPEERHVFGDLTMSVIFEVHKAAVSIGLNAPSNFRLLMLDVAKRPSEYSKCC